MDPERARVLKANLRSAFTELPYCIATYVGLLGMIVLVGKALLGR